MTPNPIFIHLFFGYLSLIFRGRPKPIFFFLFRAGGPKWGLYQANRTPILVFFRV